MANQIVVRMEPTELEFLDNLAKYLHATGRIKEATRSEVVRYAIFKVLGPIVLKEIDARRAGGDE